MSSKQDLYRIPKLSGAKKFINWRRRIKAQIQQNDFELLGFIERPSELTSSRQMSSWQKSMVKAKSSIVQILKSGPMAQTSSNFGDDSVTAKELWEALAELYTTSNEKTILNLIHELEQL